MEKKTYTKSILGFVKVESSQLVLLTYIELTSQMFYRQHIDHEDSDVITIDSGSINSDVSSPVVSPVVDENTVMNILHIDKDESVGSSRKSGTRGRFRELFRSLSWRNKAKPTTEDKGEVSDNNDAENTKEKDTHIEMDNDAFSFSNSPVRNVSSRNTFDNLYDTSKPMLHLQSNVSVDNLESFINNQENAFLPQHKESPISPATAESVLTPVNVDSIKIQKSKSPRRSLSRRFSLFSIRSRPSTAPSTLDLSNASSYFADETLLTNWRMPKYQTATVIAKRCPDHVETKRDTKLESEIYLFLNGSDNTKLEKVNRINTREKIQSNNIEKMLYFPYSKSFFDSSCLHKGNALSIRNDETNLTMSSEPHFFIYNDNSEIKTLNTEFDVDSMKRSSALSVKSMRFQELIEAHTQAAVHDNNNNICSQVNPLLELDQCMDALDVRGLIQIQAKNYNLEPSKIWKLWIDVVDKTKKSHRKFSVFTVLSEYSQIIKLQKSYDTLLDYYIHDKNQQLYILKDEEIPIFHGKHKVKTYGEYVFVIPLASAKQVWRVILHLLVSEKLSLNSSKYETIGICWRRYAYKRQYGYHLTFYVDDRVRFSYNGANLFLSDIRLMVPENVKHCFRRCKTVFPGEKEVRILDVL
ncbi:hypothetical protein PICMEDRAFT_168710 [Pichia membranifaciens NRRL Y-2026]|uniref:Uncharacterized protein n=1 Tax=Pichia membranifaciens NRRL Y-2026 TaxID=763406 RepID=A0A1E3NI66_9ASCO|nr:hypothetical protein PICMEDRAFT_168710 [Pichia membranifaciens NRRL Y-2026]ODQ45258.1 hypothetical protein PICMEDRAFT_168710 [Pichia membranifaciens NRRL Y-2026]